MWHPPKMWQTVTFAVATGLSSQGGKANPSQKRMRMTLLARKAHVIVLVTVIRFRASKKWEKGQKVQLLEKSVKCDQKSYSDMEQKMLYGTRILLKIAWKMLFWTGICPFSALKNAIFRTYLCGSFWGPNLAEGWSTSLYLFCMRGLLWHVPLFGRWTSMTSTLLMNQLSGSRKRSRSQTELMEPPVTKRTPGTILEYAKIDDDDNDARLDALVLEFVNADTNVSVLWLAASLLSIVVSNSEGLLQSQFEKTSAAKALLQEHPQLLSQLQDAWKKKSFKEIRNSGASLIIKQQMVL
jgi:hypothetical protein